MGIMLDGLIVLMRGDSTICQRHACYRCSSCISLATSRKACGPDQPRAAVERLSLYSRFLTTFSMGSVRLLEPMSSRDGEAEKTAR